MKKVIIYEGLMGRLLGSQMTKAFKKAMPGHPYETRSWTNKEEIPRGAVVLGHSFGAYRAWEKFNPEKHEALITVDLRWWTKNRNLSRKLKDEQFHFFQSASLRGYVLAGNFKSRQLYLGSYGHMRAPHHPLVIAKIQEVMNGK